LHDSTNFINTLIKIEFIFFNKKIECVKDLNILIKNMNNTIKEEDKNLELYKNIPLDGLENYLISQNGIIYNSNTKKYNIPKFSNKNCGFSIELKNKNKRISYLIKYLLYITFIDYDINILPKEVMIKKTNNELPYINFSINDLKLYKYVLEEHKNLNLFYKIPLNELNNYILSKNGIVYNTISKKYLKPYYHKNLKLYIIQLNNKQYQIKHLLYITFINPEYSLDELSDVKSKFMLNIKQTHDNLPYINFTIDDLELISKSDKLKLQARNNRIINKYDENKNFIQSYNNLEDIRAEFNTKYNKYITLACSKNKNKLYNGYYFRYDDDDEIKNPELLINNSSIGSQEVINYSTEEWKQLSGEYYDNYEISNFGRFRNINTKKILKPHESGNYLYANINIYNKELNKKEVKKIRMNVLVAQYFIPIPDILQNVPNIVVDHIDGNKSNNHYTNLQYLTLGENNCKG
jgi:hypothetical protein